MTHEKTSSYCKPCQVGTDLFEAQFEKIFSDFRCQWNPVEQLWFVLICQDFRAVSICDNLVMDHDELSAVSFSIIFIYIYIPQTPVCHMSRLKPWCWVVLQWVVDVLGQVNMFGGGGGGFQASQGQLLKGTDELKYRENICRVTV